MIEPAHILVVDDDQHIRDLLQRIMSRAGYRISVARSGEEALSYLQLVNPDLILLDLILPGIDGQEVTAQIKADQSRPFIPIILMTAQGDVDFKVTGLDAGADDVLIKPLDFKELLARVRSMLRLQRAQRGLQNEQRKTELLLHLTRELGRSLDLDELLVRFVNHLANAVGAVRASIILPELDGRPRLFSSAQRIDSSLLSVVVRSGVAGWVLQEGRPLRIADTHGDPRWIENSAFPYGVRSVSAAPILREGEAMGVITLVHHTPNYFSDEHMQLLSSVAAQSAVAIENARLYYQVSELERRERERMLAVFRRYVSPPVAAELMRQQDDVGKPVARNVAVIFADIRNYTSITEGIDAHVLVERVLNRYFTAMTEALYRFDGTVDKFLGDGVIGVFGSPIARDDDVERALNAAVAMQHSFAYLNDNWRAELGLDIGMGIGMAYGPAVVGNIGSAQRMDYTLIGDVVNTAARLASLAHARQILVSHTLVDVLPSAYCQVRLSELEKVHLKGKFEPHAVFEIDYAVEDGR